MHAEEAGGDGDRVSLPASTEVMCATPAGSVSGVRGGNGGPSGSSTTDTVTFLTLRLRGVLTGTKGFCSGANDVSAPSSKVAVTEVCSCVSTAHADCELDVVTAVVPFILTTESLNAAAAELRLRACRHVALRGTACCAPSKVAFTTRVLTRMVTPVSDLVLGMTASVRAAFGSLERSAEGVRKLCTPAVCAVCHACWDHALFPSCVITQIISAPAGAVALCILFHYTIPDHVLI